MYTVKLTKKALKDKEKLSSANLSEKAGRLIAVLRTNPYQNPPPYEKLIGDLQGFYSRRLNIQHRMVYRVEESIKTVVVHSLWSHYEN